MNFHFILAHLSLASISTKLGAKDHEVKRILVQIKGNFL